MRNKLFLEWMCIVLLLAGCAKMVTPVGGPKDVTPPSVVKEVPANGTVNFKGNSFKVTFDEFVTLNNTAENVLISPPPTTAPTFTLSGKTLTVKFQDTLLPDQTYNVGFANCIQDYTEGNPIAFYNYAFSTGNVVDSMMLEGRVIDAKTGQPVKECLVFAYTQDVDSLPLTTRPQFISKTQSNGTFQIKNIKPGNYKIFALEDGDNNLLYSQPTEAVAFAETLYPSVPSPKKAVDTAAIDSVKPQVEPVDSTYKPFTIRLFRSIGQQNMTKSQNRSAGKYEFIFSEEINDVELRPLKAAPDFFTYFGHDTLILYFKSLVTDTLQLACVMDGEIVDTLEVTPYKAKETKGRRGREDHSNSLSVSVNNKGELFKPLTLSFSYPVRPVDSVSARIVAKRKYSGNDTSFITLSVPDTFVMSLPIPFKFAEKVPYELMIPDSSFQGYDGCWNDTVVASFTTKTEKDYGTLRLTYRIPDNGKVYVATLLSSSDTELQSDRLTSSTTIVYDKIPAGKYKAKLLEDVNDNGKWDTGDYKEKRLPEVIQFLSKSLSIRGYWELEETFEWKEE